MNRVITVCLTALIMTQALAENTGPWSAKAGLGYLSTSGNSETTNVSASFDTGYEIGRWHHSLGLIAMGAESGGASTAERYGLAYKTKWDIHAWDYAFGSLDYEKDKFSGVEQSLSEAVGYGRRLLKNEVHVLNAEVGLGLRQQDYRDGTDDSGAIVKLGGDYRYTFSPTAHFTQVLNIEIGGDNTATHATSAISARLRDELALVLSYTVKNNSEVPAGLKKTDTFTAINLEYSF